MAAKFIAKLEFSLLCAKNFSQNPESFLIQLLTLVSFSSRMSSKKELSEETAMPFLFVPADVVPSDEKFLKTLQLPLNRKKSAVANQPDAPSNSDSLFHRRTFY